MTLPRVLVAIHAKQAAGLLPYYLQCLEAQDYPKDHIGIRVSTNNNTDSTYDMLMAWVNRSINGPDRFAHMELWQGNFPEPVQDHGAHEWTPERFSVLGRVRQETIQRTLDLEFDFYFTADVDNFLHPHTLRTLVSLNLPIVAPFLKNADRQPGEEGSLYSNFHDGVDANGYLRQTPNYMPIFTQQAKGIHEVPVVHCTYLVRADAIPHLRYQDGTGRHEYVIFAESARKASIKQYLDNREVYGWLTFEPDSRKAEEAMRS